MIGSYCVLVLIVLLWVLFYDCVCCCLFIGLFGCVVAASLFGFGCFVFDLLFSGCVLRCLGLLGLVVWRFG